MVFARLLKSLKSTTDAGALVAQIGTVVPVRHRYILTRSGGLRLRYAAPPALLASFAALTVMQATVLPVVSDTVNGFYVAALAPAAGEPEEDMAALDGQQDQDVADSDGLLMSRYAAVARRLDLSAGYEREGAQVPVVPPAPAKKEPRHNEVAVGKGDTLAGLLQRAGLSGSESYQAVEALKKHYDPRSLRPGQTLAVDFVPSVDGTAYDFAALRMEIDALRTVSLTRTPDGAYESALEEKKTVRRMTASRAEIETSLYGSALKAGIPTAIVAETIRAYSWDVDFQRDIRRGDALDVMYERYETEDGGFVRTGDVVFARLNIGGRDIPVYRYEMKDGNVDYFTADGKSIRKALLSTPVDGARLSSGFGMRKHPVLGYTKMHKGVDFAAPSGTPIYAAGDGTVVKAGPFSSFGNYVRIRHNSSIDTAYAHMKGFGKGIRAGARVKQGQIIGYIGTTGRSTGPHLHYEVMMNGAQVNPRGIKLPQGEELKGQQLEAFKAYTRSIDGQYAALAGGQFASVADGSANGVSLR